MDTVIWPSGSQGYEVLPVGSRVAIGHIWMKGSGARIEAVRRSSGSIPARIRHAMKRCASLNGTPAAPASWAGFVSNKKNRPLRGFTFLNPEGGPRDR
jgi:hypothetical protein